MLKNLFATLLITASTGQNINKSFNVPRRQNNNAETYSEEIYAENQPIIYTEKGYEENNATEYIKGAKLNFNTYFDTAEINGTIYVTWHELHENNTKKCFVKNYEITNDRYQELTPNILMVVAISTKAVMTNNTIDIPTYLWLDDIIGHTNDWKLSGETYTSIRPTCQNLINVQNPINSQWLANKREEINTESSQYNAQYNGDFETTFSSNAYTQPNLYSVPLLANSTTYLLVEMNVQPFLSDPYDTTNPYFFADMIDNEFGNTPIYIGYGVDYPVMYMNGNYVAGDYNYEIINLPGLMFQILTMPFTFLSVAFDLTLFSGTPYAINLSNLFLTVLGILIFVFIIKLITKRS